MLYLLLYTSCGPVVIIPVHRFATRFGANINWTVGDLQFSSCYWRYTSLLYGTLSSVFTDTVTGFIHRRAEFHNRHSRQDYSVGYLTFTPWIIHWIITCDHRDPSLTELKKNL